MSKRKLGRALLACPYAIATGVLSILRGYFDLPEAITIKENRILHGIPHIPIAYEQINNGTDNQIYSNMNDVNVRSVRYPLATDLKFEKTALKLGRTKRLLFTQMVDYFYKSKKDPADLNDEFFKKHPVKEP